MRLGGFSVQARPIRTANILSIPLMGLLSANAAVAVAATVLTTLFSVINSPIAFFSKFSDRYKKRKIKMPAVLHYMLILVGLLFAISADN